MARGWYGLELGDRVKFLRVEGEIIHLYQVDKNRARMKCDDGSEIDVVCEWCQKLG